MRRPLHKLRACTVIEYDHVHMRVARVRRRGESLEVEALAERPVALQEQSLAACLRELGHDQTLPRATILVTSEAVPALLSLPAEITTEAERAEMIRWELEPYLSDQGLPPSLAAIAAAQALAPPARPADRADPQMVQERWPASDDAPVCGWQPVGGQWLAAGIARSRLDYWQLLLAEQELRLRAVVPLLTASLGALTSADLAGALELTGGTLGFTALDAGRIASLSTASADRPENLWPSTMTLPAAPVALVGRLANGTQLAERLRSRGIPVSMQEDAALAPLLGAVHLVCGSAPNVPVPVIAVRREQIPWRQHPLVHAVAIVILLVGLLAYGIWQQEASLGSLRAERDRLASQLMQASHSPAERIDSSRLSELRAEVQAMRVERQRRTAVLAREQARHRALTLVNPQRNRQAVSVLQAVAEAINTHVSLDQLHSGAEGLVVTGWSLNERDAHRFAADLESSSGMPLSATTITAATGGPARAGYRFTIQFATNREES